MDRLPEMHFDYDHMQLHNGLNEFSLLGFQRQSTYPTWVLKPQQHRQRQLVSAAEHDAVHVGLQHLAGQWAGRPDRLSERRPEPSGQRELHEQARDAGAGELARLGHDDRYASVDDVQPAARGRLRQSAGRTAAMM